MTKIIAEIGAGHGGRLEGARQLIDAAAQAGADIIKLQCFDPAQMVGTRGYRVESGPWKGADLLTLYNQAHTPKGWFPDLIRLIRKLGKQPMVSVFHPDDVGFVADYGHVYWKIAALEANWDDLIWAATEKGGPVFISTGMLEDADRLEHMVDDLVLMHSISAYPTPESRAGLGRLNQFPFLFLGREVGLSDHTRGSLVAQMAVAMGVDYIEKHIGFRSSLDGDFALDPMSFQGFVSAIRHAEEIMQPRPMEGMSELRRSLWFARDLEAGHEIQPEDLKVARPWGGRDPGDFNDVVGTVLSERVEAGSPVR